MYNLNLNLDAEKLQIIINALLEKHTVESDEASHPLAEILIDHCEIKKQVGTKGFDFVGLIEDFDGTTWLVADTNGYTYIKDPSDADFDLDEVFN